MNTRLRVLLILVLSSLVSSTAYAQISGGPSPAAASPYAQHRSKAYTSFDNPYAPGGIYDPYRGNKLSSSGQKDTPKSKLVPFQKGGSDPTSSTYTGAGQSNDNGKAAGATARCGDKRLGGNSAAGRAGINHLGDGLGGSSSILGHCGGSSSYGQGYSGKATSATGLSGRRGMNGQGQTLGTQQH